MNQFVPIAAPLPVLVHHGFSAALFSAVGSGERDVHRIHQVTLHGGGLFVGGVERDDDLDCIVENFGDEIDCALDIVSHARKGQTAPGDAARERGASSKKDAGRLMRTVTGMTADEAELFAVTNKDRAALVRVDDAKVNLTPRSPDAMWFQLVGVALGNATTLTALPETRRSNRRMIAARLHWTYSIPQAGSPRA